MPAKNPRLTVTLQPQTQAQLVRISQLTGNSQSSLISTLLETQSAVFDRLIRVLEAAELAKEKLKGNDLAEQMLAAQAQIESQLGLALEDFDRKTDDLVEQVESINRRSGRAGKRSAAAPAGRTSTPPSNRGVRSLPAKGKKSTRTRT